MKHKSNTNPAQWESFGVLSLGLKLGLNFLMVINSIQFMNKKFESVYVQNSAHAHARNPRNKL